MNKIIPYWAPTVFVALLALSACGKGRKDYDPAEDARAMIKESVEMTSRYRDSIKLSRDSASIMTLLDNYDRAIVRINYKYKPDIYLHVTESQNEVLTNVTLRMLAIKDSILYRLAHPSQPTDTLETPVDSVAPGNVSQGNATSDSKTE